MSAKPLFALLQPDDARFDLSTCALFAGLTRRAILLREARLPINSVCRVSVRQPRNALFTRRTGDNPIIPIYFELRFRKPRVWGKPNNAGTSRKVEVVFAVSERFVCGTLNVSLKSGLIFR